MPERLFAEPSAAVPFRPAALHVPAPDASARAEGFAAGYAAGAREAALRAAEDAHARALTVARTEERRSAEHAQLVAALEGAVAAIRATHAPVLAEVEERLHALALELAGAVLGVELADEELVARAALARVLDHPHRPADLTVRVHPEDLALLAAAGLPEGVALVGDAALGRGDAVAEYADGLLDARLSTSYDRARAAFAGAQEDRS